MAVIFDGYAFAERTEKKLKLKVNNLRKRNIIPQLASILVGSDPASMLYVNLKSKAAERIGCKVKILKFPPDIVIDRLIEEIKKMNKDSSIHGIMIQLPLPENFSINERDRLLDEIQKSKDVDGLRKDSNFLTPVVKAIIDILKEASPYIVRPALKEPPYKVCVVGYKGFEGVKITKVLEEMGYDVDGADSDTYNLKTKTLYADIIISLTGKPGIIDSEMVKDNAVVIDVGAPKGDIKSQELLNKVSFISPVPGGVGPVTISCLLENLVDAAKDS